jgi:hypothetical protein
MDVGLHELIPELMGSAGERFKVFESGVWGYEVVVFVVHAVRDGR